MYFIGEREVVIGQTDSLGRMGWVFKDTGEPVALDDINKEKANESTSDQKAGVHSPVPRAD